MLPNNACTIMGTVAAGVVRSVLVQMLHRMLSFAFRPVLAEENDEALSLFPWQPMGVSI